MCRQTNLAGQIFKFCHYDVIMVKFFFRICYCDVTNDKISVLAGQNCRPCQVIIIYKNSSYGSFSMFSYKSLTFRQISYGNPSQVLLPQESGLVGFPRREKFEISISWHSVTQVRINLGSLKLS